MGKMMKAPAGARFVLTLSGLEKYHVRVKFLNRTVTTVPLSWIENGYVVLDRQKR